MMLFQLAMTDSRPWRGAQPGWMQATGAWAAQTAARASRSR